MSISRTNSRKTPDPWKGWSRLNLEELLETEGLRVPPNLGLGALKAFATQLFADRGQAIPDKNSARVRPTIGRDNSSKRFRGDNRPGVSRQASNVTAPSMRRALSAKSMMEEQAKEKHKRIHTQKKKLLEGAKGSRFKKRVDVDRRRHMDPYSAMTKKIEGKEDAPLSKDDARFMRDFDPLYDVMAGESVDPYEPATWSAAKRYADLHHPRRPNMHKLPIYWTHIGRLCPMTGFMQQATDLCGEGSASELSRYGPGISLYFKILKLLIGAFCLFAALTAPQVFINSSVASSSADVGATRGVFKTTLGNLGDERVDFVIFKSFNLTALPGVDGFNTTENGVLGLPSAICNAAGKGNEECSIDRATLGRLYGWLDFCVSSIMLLSLFWLRYFVTYEKRQVAKTFISLDNYTVYVPVIPERSDESDLKTYFEEAVGERVDEVSVAQDNGKLIHTYIERGEVLSEMWKVTGRCKLLSEMEIVGTRLLNESEVARNVAEKMQRSVHYYDLLKAHYEYLNQRVRVYSRSKGRENSLAAFVTFGTQVGYWKALALFRPGRDVGSKFLCGQPSPSELFKSLPSFKQRSDANDQQNNARIKPFNQQLSASRGFDGPTMDSKSLFRSLADKVDCYPAPPPSTVLWENIEYKPYQRASRMLVAFFLTMLALTVTLAASYGAQAYRTELQREDSSSTKASDEACAALFTFGSITTGVNGTIVTRGTLFDTQEEAFSYMTNSSNPNADVLLDCFCRQYSFQQLYEAVFDSNDVCHDYWRDRAPLLGFTGVVAGVVSVVNILFGLIVREMTDFEKHRSVVHREVSVSMRLFLAYLINTGIVIVLVNVRFDQSTSSFFGFGLYPDFVSEWYANVGAQLVVVMLVNMIAPHLQPVLQYSSHHFNRRFGDKALLQRELNERFLGPEFPFAFRSAQVAMIAFVSLLYGAGMPVLYPIAVASFAGFFALDKVLFVRFYRTPPEYDHVLAKYTVWTLAVATVLHQGIAIWMYSAFGIFYVGSDVDGGVGISEVGLLNEALGITTSQKSLSLLQRATLAHTLPLSLLMICSFVALVFGYFLFETKVCRRKAAEKGDLLKELLPPLDAVRASGWLRGLHSYNILQNPKYARAFGIPKSFADSHRAVAHVHLLPEGEVLPQLPKGIRNLGLTKRPKQKRP